MNMKPGAVKVTGVCVGGEMPGRCWCSCRWGAALTAFQVVLQPGADGLREAMSEGKQINAWLCVVPEPEAEIVARKFGVVDSVAQLFCEGRQQCQCEQGISVLFA